MGDVRRDVERCKLLVGVLYSDAGQYEVALRRLELEFGPLDGRSEAFDFDFTDYYSAELGEGIKREWLTFEDLILPDQLVAAKLHTNRMEEWLAGQVSDGDGKRRVNLDPGYIGLGKLVLASTKDFAHRIYLREGIFAEITLRYSKGLDFVAASEWTYPDYQLPGALEFFNRARLRLKEQLKECHTTSG